MPKKGFLLEVGERTGDPQDQDQLYKDKVSKRKQAQIDRQEEIDQKEHETKVAKLEKDKAAAEAAMDKAEKPKEAESPFKVKGEIDMGHINYQEMIEKSNAERDKLRLEAEEAAKTQAGINEGLRERLHAAELNAVTVTFNAQIANLKDLILSQASKGTFVDQLKEAKDTAQEIGFMRPSGETGDLMAQIKLKEMEFNQTRELRKMDREAKQSDRDFQLELRKFDDERDERKQTAAQQSKRDEMFAKAPEVIGRAIGRAIVESEAEGGGIREGVSKGVKHYQITIPPEHGGEMDCEQCGEIIGIGPTAKVAVCANCGARVQIKRGEAKQEVEPEEE